MSRLSFVSSVQYFCSFISANIRSTGNVLDMALIGVKSRSFPVPAKKKNALRFFNLTMDLGTQAVRLYFNSLVPAGSLQEHLRTHMLTILKLQQRKILKKCHTDILFPKTSKFIDYNYLAQKYILPHLSRKEFQTLINMTSQFLF